MESTIPLFKVFMAHDAGEAVLHTLYSGMVTQGPQVEAFEYLLKRWLDVKNLLTVNSGTSALQLAVKLAGVEHGDYVLSTPMTCTATNTAIRAVGGHIHWVDISFVDGNMNPASLEEELRKIARGEGPAPLSKYKAIMAVDWGGQPCDWTELRRIADEWNLQLIEDAAHAFGAKYDGEYLGRIADFTCYSFQAIKHLTTVDGGALICKNDAAYERGKLLRWFGIDREQPRKDFRCETDVIEAGYKYHMNDVTAAIGCAQIPHMDRIVNAHKQNGKEYDAWLADMRAMWKRYDFNIPTRRSNTESSYWVYTMLVKPRTEFMKHMADRGIVTSQVHARNDLHTMFRPYYRDDLRSLEIFAEQQINIPVGWWVTEQDREKICRAISAFFTSKSY